MPEMERRLRKNPSRKECEDIIRRILMTEMLEKGKNEHFKTAEQLDQDQELSFMLQKSKAHVTSLEDYETLFLATDPNYKSYLLQLIRESKTCHGKYITILDTTDGLLFYTENASQLRILLESLMQHS